MNSVLCCHTERGGFSYLKRIYIIYGSTILDNPGQNICNETEKSSKTGQEKKSLISTFVCLLTVIVKV